MPDLFLIIVILLFILAASDLIVGVSNDAVNFLNSAIGSKVAPRHVIMIVASLGIFIGATFSSGMMEVARKGIFNPGFFVFTEIMVIFLAVMLTDIILLDLFNTLGMPTSTTVSIVFELLGATVVMSFIKVLSDGDSLSVIGQYINSEKAVQIILGIFLSVIFAFLAGVVIQYFSRLLFTFQYKKRMKYLGAVWGGLALAAITYFLLLKGIKGASFASDAVIDFVQQNTVLLFLAAFALWAIILQVLIMTKVNIFRIIVLFGTFALAMAFAGNDLVNFIGVPIAGYESFLTWSASQADPGSFTMESLQEPVRTKSYLLIIAGIIMIVTLWLSKKARSVTETEVNLGRQEEGYERFTPNFLARWLVRNSTRFGSIAARMVPRSWIDKAESRFTVEKRMTGGDQQAFDLVRASVNLTMASILIAFATSLKLPLSTTYVSFMVAMGTSLADRAWGRDSAVYRVAGVMNVIGGWFATALIAFVVSGTFCFLIFQFRISAIALLVLLAGIFIYRTFVYHKRKEQRKAERLAADQQTKTITVDALMSDMTVRMAKVIDISIKAFDDAVEGLLREDMARLKKAQDDVHAILRKNEDFRYALYSSIRRMSEMDSEGSRMFLLAYDLEQDYVQSIRFIVQACYDHVANALNPLESHQIKSLNAIINEVESYLHLVKIYLQDQPENHLESILEHKTKVYHTLERMMSDQVDGIKEVRYGARNSLVYFSIILETKDLIAVSARFAKLFKRVRYWYRDQSISLLDGKDTVTLS